jgi:hypothetical protein
MRNRLGLSSALVVFGSIVPATIASAHGGPNTAPPLFGQPIFVAAWALLMIFFLASIARWRRFAARYPFRDSLPKNTIGWHNGGMLGLWFRGLLSVGTTDHALVVAVSFPPLRALIPAIAVPWEAVTPRGKVRRIFLMSDYLLGGTAKLSVYHGNAQDRLIQNALAVAADREIG